MAAAEENTTPTAPTSVEMEIQEDLWLYGGRRWSKNARWFALSTAVHVLLLALLATLTLTITQKRQEMIKVKTLPLSGEDQQLFGTFNQAAVQVMTGAGVDPTLRPLVVALAVVVALAAAVAPARRAARLDVVEVLRFD